MKVLLTGTPGTGKTTIAKQLEDDFEVINLTELVKKEEIGQKTDKGEIEVDIKQLKEEINSVTKENSNYMIEGHLAHYLEGEYCIVLRCNPETLEERLSKRNYSDQKVNDNVESEMMGLILSEAIQRQEKIYEIDTTNQSVEETVSEIKSAVNNLEEKYGNVDWF